MVWYARVELRLGVVDALPDTPFPARHRSLGICRSRAGRGIGGGLELRGVGWCDGAGVVPGVESGGRAVCECGRRHIRISIYRRSLSILFCGPSQSL